MRGFLHNLFHSFLVLAILFGLSACSNTTQQPVDDKSSQPSNSLGSPNGKQPSNQEKETEETEKEKDEKNPQTISPEKSPSEEEKKPTQETKPSNSPLRPKLPPDLKPKRKVDTAKVKDFSLEV
ncbi:MAG: hypothetical protein JNN15_03635 [Blastocatellia bacterium]|nr:hypothetical protein [Blastocatellia bacterium]